MTAIGILGGGQLGRMLALAGHPLGIECVVLDPSPDAPAGKVAPAIVAPYADAAALDALADRCEIATYEFENVPVEAARRVATRIPVRPGPRALEAAQDRLAEKALFRTLGLATAPFEPVEDLASLGRALAATGLPAVLKTRREGYDGKGQVVIRQASDAEAAMAAIGGRPAIVERFVAFERELSILAVRSARGEVAFYPLVENRHREGILRLSRAPAKGVDPGLSAQAESGARRVLEALDYVGVLAIEFFEKEGTLYANEMAPRVHNSGHWTIEGAATSQFENHLRAILGWPLGATEARGASAMTNLVGALPVTTDLLAIPGAHVHLYGKTPRPGRKVGHVTVVASSGAEIDAALRRVAAIVREPALETESR